MDFTYTILLTKNILIEVGEGKDKYYEPNHMGDYACLITQVVTTTQPILIGRFQSKPFVLDGTVNEKWDTFKKRLDAILLDITPEQLTDPKDLPKKRIINLN